MVISRIKIILQILIWISLWHPCIGQTTVSNTSALNSAIQSAVPGSVIILANATWTNVEININKAGTLENPIVIKAETPGQVFFEGNSSIHFGGSYIYFEGVIFQNASNLVVSSNRIDPIIEFRDNSNNECNHCQVTNVKIDSYNGTSVQSEAIFKWVLIYGQYNEISYCSFLGKYGVGSVINDNRNDNDPNYSSIHHNYFADRIPVGDFNALNDQDAIRIGNSSTSLSDSYTEVYDNYFNNWSGEIEIISNKSGSNKYYNNTFRNYQGCLTLRHGNNNEVYGNYFFANQNNTTAGIRVIGEDQRVYNNYIEGINSRKEGGSLSGATGGINVTNGRENSELSGYYQVKNSQIINNTFVNCDYAIRIGTKVSSDLSLAPVNLIIANNIMLNSTDRAISITTAATGSSIYEGNITQNGNWDITTGTNSNIISTNLLLVTDGSFHRLNTGSSAIDASIGTYTFVYKDIIGGIRTNSTDTGAEEFGSSGTNFPYTDSSIGISVGFGAPSSAEIDLVINNDMTSTDDIVCNNLIINSTKTLTISSGHTLSVKGDLTTNGTLIIKSGGSLITTNGNVIDEVIIERNTSFANGKYSLVGTPVNSNASITGSDLGPTSYSYDETKTYNTVGGPRWVDARTAQLIPGKGYAQAFQEVINFTGIPNDGDITVSGISYSAGIANEQGWNLLSNPYPAAIDLESFLNENSTVSGAIGNAVYLWDDGGSDVNTASNNDYLTVSTLGTVGGPNGGTFNGYIASMQGFFVKVVTEGTASVKFTEDMRVIDNNTDVNFFRKELDKSLPKIRLAIESNSGFYSELLIGFREDATFGLDRKYDVLKLQANDHLQFYSLINGDKYAIQGLPIQEASVTELAFDLGETSDLKLLVKDLSGLESNMTCFLTDMETNKVYDLQRVNDFDFSAAKGFDQNRFILSYAINNVLSIKQSYNLPIYRYLDNELLVSFNHPINVFGFMVYDISGRIILRNSIHNSGQNQLAIPITNKGINIIHIETSEGAFTRKFMF